MRSAELPGPTQAKLLRVLQEHEFDRVGGTAPRKVDVRVIAATNRDLQKAVQEKAFREDLYYRLSVFPVQLPPLRERPEDIPLLAEYLLDRFAARIGRRFDGIEPATLRRLVAYPWPGNIRELQNVLERAVILAAGPLLEVDAEVLGRPLADRDDAAVIFARRRRTEPYHQSLAANQLGHRGAQGRSGNPRSSPQHPS